MDYHAIYAQGLAGRLGLRERLLAMSEFRRPRGGPVKLHGRTAGVHWAPPRRSLPYLLFGRTATGPADSAALRYATSLDYLSLYLVVVTNQRLAIFHSGRRDADMPLRRPMPAARLRPAWEVPRAEIVSATPVRHRLHAGRLRIELADGSIMELTGALTLRRRGAEAIASALATAAGAATGDAA